jgi:FkbM family methyltransferase
MAYRVGSTGLVLSVEPSPALLPLLRKNLYSMPAEIFPCAMGRTQRNVQLHNHQLNAKNAGLGFVSEQASDDSFTVSMRTLDSLVEASGCTVQLVKIDTEGYEMEVLAGASHSLASKSVKHIVYEDNSADPIPMIGFLGSFGYEVFGIEKGFLGPRLTAPEKPRSVASWETVNYVATIDSGELRSAMKGSGYKVLSK